MIFTEEDRLRELRLAQKDIYNAGNDLVSAGLRLQGTKYEKSYERIYKSLNALNRKLIADINKKRKWLVTITLVTEMAEQKYFVIADAKDIEQIKSSIERLCEKVDQLLNDRLEHSDTYLTSEEAAKLLKISRRTLHQWRKAGTLRYSQIGRKVFFKNEDVQKLIDRNTLG